MKKCLLVPVMMMVLTILTTLGCGSRQTSVVPAPPAQELETTIPGLDPNSPEYQQAMSAQQ
jgi:hypothetical protein